MTSEINKNDTTYNVSLWTKLKLWNRTRLRNNRIKRLLRDDPKNRPSIPYPNSISTLLFIEAQKGWGDYLYFLGLLKKVSEAGVIIDVASHPSTFHRYKKIPFIRDTFSMSNEIDRNEISSRKYDIAIDVTYVNTNSWDYRKPLLSKLNCHTMTTSDMAANSKYYDQFIDISTKCHWQKRNALIYNTLLRPTIKISRIPPYYPVPFNSEAAQHFLSTFKKGSKLVYINTVGGNSSRTFSQQQVEAIAETFNERRTSIGIIYSNFQIKETNFVKILPKLEFNDLTKVVQSCNAIISPDTSIIHLGSALNIPVLGIYCGNNRDYWRQYAMQDVWAPLSEGSIIYCEDDIDVTNISDYVYSHPKKSISGYDPRKIQNLCVKFLDLLKI